MKFTIVTEPIPYLIIDNTFSIDEQNLIYKELEFLQPKLLGAEHTGPSLYEDGSSKKKNTGVFLDALFTNREFSDILRINRKLFNKEVRQAAVKCHPAYGLINSTSSDSTLISYYEDTDHYAPHIDYSITTMVSWFFKTPKNFEGGEFIFSDYNIKIEPVNNRTVLFLSCYRHEVTRILMKDITVPCSGRFSMSIFSKS